ncbi:MAG: SPASM domain-containing protein [Lactobacillales bacterium]|jgi:uncharacterized protein|nr:SPASM domain-containing protein [Lactobacillales bacterium]
MKWSRYSKLFKSKRNGWLLYNSASNAFLKLDEQAASVIQEIIKSPKTYDFSNAISLYFQLRTSGFLVEDTKDDDLFNILKMRRLLVGYATDTLSLTIAPTRNCNFACHYCYETNRTKSMMSDETVESLLKFIEMHKAARRFFLVWYGGEPLLAYKKIKQINAGIEELKIPYSSKMITNGYCLTPEICEELNDMHISFIQITIDGDKETHNSRRFLISGGKTFDRIVSNVDTLLKSSWKGTLNLRVNVDARNSKKFANVYRFIQNKYDDEILSRVYVYPGFVHGEATSPDISCFFNSEKKGEFIAKLAREEKITPLPIFPQSKCTACTLVQHNTYVVGPGGELYKCWHDVGEKDKVTGNIASFKNWNMALVAEGMVSGNYLEDERCEKCFFFPVCDGGCPKVRMLNKRDGKKRDHCSYFKNNLEELLEIHYEQKHGKETVKS